MNKKILLSAILLLGIVCIGYVVIAARQSAQTASHSPMPPGFASIQMGMTESQVVSLLGQPQQKTRYARYEQKPAAFWAALEKQAAAADSQPVYTNTPSMAAIRARAELTHRYRDVWLYRPVPSLIETFYFGDDGTLLNMGTAAGGGKGGSGGPGPPAPTAASHG